MAEVRTEQVLKQDQFMAEIDASQTSNEELRKANEELRKDLQQLGECSTGSEAWLLDQGLALGHFHRRLWTHPLSY